MNERLLEAMWDVRPYLLARWPEGNPAPSMLRYDALLREGLDTYCPRWGSREEVEASLLREVVT